MNIPGESNRRCQLGVTFIIALVLDKYRIKISYYKRIRMCARGCENGNSVLEGCGSTNVLWPGPALDKSDES
jgi:hypothetical protein